MNAKKPENLPLSASLLPRRISPIAGIIASERNHVAKMPTSRPNTTSFH
jgi:hypothetical protein